MGLGVMMSNEKAQNDSAQVFKLCVRVVDNAVYDDLSARHSINGFSHVYNETIMLIDLRDKEFLTNYDHYNTWELVHETRQDHDFMLVVLG